LTILRWLAEYRREFIINIMAKPPLTSTQAAVEIRKVFADFNCPIAVADDEISVTENVVLLGFKGDRLANALFDFAFPRSHPGIYYHYTSYGGFKGIVSSGKLRLYNLHRRFGSGEFRTFCRDYDLDGYVRDGHAGEEGIYAELMDDLFYVSFVDSPTASEEKLWQTFADWHRGVRLRFEVRPNPKYPNFRQVAYQGCSQVPLIKALQDTFRGYDRRFVTLGLSRMGGFYQRADYSYQAEHRLLVKRFPDAAFPFDIKSVNGERYSFIECDLNNPSRKTFDIKLQEVCVGRDCSVQNLKNYIAERSKIPGLVVT
jgi:hypothetical protein